MVKYYLMHKNDVCGELLYDEKRGVIHSYKDNHTGRSPFLGNCDSDKILDWWKIRTIPASRNMLQDILQKAGCNSTSELLAKNLAFSMTDTYWICPVDYQLKYEDIRFANFSGYNEGKIPYHNESSCDANASLGGQMEKYWDLQQEVPILVKESGKYYGQQSINEVFATHLHKLQNNQIPFVSYTAMYTDTGTTLSKCPSFTSDNIELIPAYEVVNSTKVQNDISLYDAYIEICVQNGFDRDKIQSYMDYQTLSDFVISNEDEHLLNFGILRDADTLKLIGPAPIYDSGNSMFFSDIAKRPYSRVSMLERKINSFYDVEEKMLAKVKDKYILREDLLPSPKEVKELYTQSKIPEWKADVISQNYKTKLHMLQEYQHGKKISLYHEKKNEKESVHENLKAEKSDAKFIMMCGLPDSGKTAIAKQFCLDIQNQGMEIKDSCLLFPIKNVTNDFGVILSKEELSKTQVVFPDYKNSVVYISADDIRRELEKNSIHPDHSVVYLVAELRVKSGLSSEAIVVFDASNIDRDIRLKYLDIAKNENCHDNQLFVVNSFNKNMDPGISEQKLSELMRRFEANYPTDEEGWTKIIEIGKHIEISQEISTIER